LSEVDLKVVKPRLVSLATDVTSPRFCLIPDDVIVCNLFDAETCVRNLDPVPVKVVVKDATKVPLREGRINAAAGMAMGVATAPISEGSRSLTMLSSNTLLI
jgi:hypothetical protein